jgi:hypothetical protein
MKPVLFLGYRPYTLPESVSNPLFEQCKECHICLVGQKGSSMASKVLSVGMSNIHNIHMQKELIIHGRRQKAKGLWVFRDFSRLSPTNPIYAAIQHQVALFERSILL